MRKICLLPIFPVKAGFDCTVLLSPHPLHPPNQGCPERPLLLPSSYDGAVAIWLMSSSPLEDEGLLVSEEVEQSSSSGFRGRTQQRCHLVAPYCFFFNTYGDPIKTMVVWIQTLTVLEESCMKSKAWMIWDDLYVYNKHHLSTLLADFFFSSQQNDGNATGVFFSFSLHYDEERGWMWEEKKTAGVFPSPRVG